MVTVVAPVRPRASIERLGWQDLANLVVEAADTPMHMAVLAILDGRPLRGVSRRAFLERARREVARRLTVLPELRQVLHDPPALAGRPVWIDDPSFDIKRHVRLVALPAPGRDAQLQAATQRLTERLLDRGRPLWEMWLITGLRGERFAVLLKVHHSVADGLGMLRIAGVLFGPDPGEPDVLREPSAAPSSLQLTRLAARDLVHGTWSAVTALTDPVGVAGSALSAATTFLSIAGRTWRGRRAPIRHPIGRHRTLGVVRLDLDTVKRVAHAHGATVSELVLTLAAAGIARGLHASGESRRDVVLRALVAVNPPAVVPGRRNSAGAIVVSLPVAGGTWTDRLAAIASDTRRARRWQKAGLVEGSLVLVTRTHLGRFLSRHQDTVDLAVSNLKGPVTPLHFAGCELVDAIPMTPISGNVTIDFCALSYAGRFNVGVLADAAAWPDLSPVVRGMQAAWADLRQAAFAG